MGLILFSAVLLVGNIILFYIIFCRKSKIENIKHEKDTIIWSPNTENNKRDTIKSKNIDLTEGIDIEYINQDAPATSDVSEKVIEIKNYKTNIEFSNRLI